MTVTSSHTNACFQAWMNCEDLLMDIAQEERNLSRKISKVLDECALICMGTFHAFKNRSVNSSRYALLCVGICEECAEVCEQLEEEPFRQCARICRECSLALSMLIPGSSEQQA